MLPSMHSDGIRPSILVSDVATEMTTEMSVVGAEMRTGGSLPGPVTRGQVQVAMDLGWLGTCGSTEPRGLGEQATGYQVWQRDQQPTG